MMTAVLPGTKSYSHLLEPEEHWQSMALISTRSIEQAQRRGMNIGY
jgi:hypothetical protein